MNGLQANQIFASLFYICLRLSLHHLLNISPFCPTETSCAAAVRAASYCAIQGLHRGCRIKGKVAGKKLMYKLGPNRKLKWTKK